MPVRTLEPGPVELQLAEPVLVRAEQRPAERVARRELAILRQLTPVQELVPEPMPRLAKPL